MKYKKHRNCCEFEREIGHKGLAREAKEGISKGTIFNKALGERVGKGKLPRYMYGRK